MKDTMATEATKVNPGAVGAGIMRQASPEGQEAMGDFMQSERAPQAMARRMGDGDVMVGMRWMMEMMASMGGSGTMGGQGGTMQPGGAHPGK